MHQAVYNAIEAIEQRHQTRVNDTEHIASVGAEAGLQLLIAELSGRCV